MPTAKKTKAAKPTAKPASTQTIEEWRQEVDHHETQYYGAIASLFGAMKPRKKNWSEEEVRTMLAELLEYDDPTARVLGYIQDAKK